MATPPPRRTRFRFKSHSTSSHRRRSTKAEPSTSNPAAPDSPASDKEAMPDAPKPHASSTPSQRRRRKPAARSAPSPQSQTPATSGPLDSPPPSPDAAFQAALSESLRSPAAAIYWEAVYGQPLHIYSRYRRLRKEPRERSRDGSTTHSRSRSSSPLERMSDDEYAAHVRSQMWARSAAHAAEQREAHEAARQAARDAEHRERRDARRWAGDWEELAADDEARETAERERAARREERRRAERSKRSTPEMGEDEGAEAGWDDIAWTADEDGDEDGQEDERLAARWAEYEDVWDVLVRGRESGGAENGMAGAEGRADATTAHTANAHTTTAPSPPPAIPWPTRSGVRLPDQPGAAAVAEVEAFFAAGVRARRRQEQQTAASRAQDLAALLKAERVRWHPDRVGRRVGQLGDEDARGVTAVFQIVDALYVKWAGRAR